MIYRSLGIMSGSSLDGIDMAMVEFEEIRNQWTYSIEAADTIPYEAIWTNKLASATTLNARDYLLLHEEYGHFLGKEISGFIQKNQLEHRVQMISSHGHTTFHEPAMHMTAQLGSGAAIAAETGINVISDLRALDVALGGQGAPIVPIGEKYLFPDYRLFLNIGGIANIAIHTPDEIIAFDVCPANKILNMLSQQRQLDFDRDGALAAAGNINTSLLTKLNALAYYQTPYPKSLDNGFGINTVLPMILQEHIPLEDALRTYVEHIAMQIGYAMAPHLGKIGENAQMLITGGGALNIFLQKRINAVLQQYGVKTFLPDTNTIAYKEAIIMAFMGILRWREENTVLNTVTGAKRSSIGGAVWIGQEY